MLTYLKYLRVLLFFTLFCDFLWAGQFTITGTNWTTSGMTLSTSGAAPLVYDATGFYTTSPSVEVKVVGFNIRPNQSWESLTVNINQTGTGTVDFYLISSNNLQLQSLQSQTSTITIDLSKESRLGEGNTFYIIFRLNDAGVNITSIVATYSGDEVICYPSPYQISSGNMSIAYELQWKAKVTLEIYDGSGKLVVRLKNESVENATPTPFASNPTWNGKDGSGRIVNTGVYTVVVRVRYVDAAATIDKYTASFRVLVIR